MELLTLRCHNCGATDLKPIPLDSGDPATLIRQALHAEEPGRSWFYDNSPATPTRRNGDIEIW